jgi:hypothetical protein
MAKKMAGYWDLHRCAWVLPDPATPPSDEADRTDTTPAARGDLPEQRDPTATVTPA